MPKLLLGFIVIVGVLLFLVYNDPPKNLCDIQMAEVKKRLIKGFYRGNDRGRYESGIKSSYNNCMDTNSPGACLDIIKRYDFFEEQIRAVPKKCGPHPSTNFVKKLIEKGSRLIVMIGWGEKPPINRYNRTSWLDTADLALFCRLKGQYYRLFGKAQWKLFAKGTIGKLPDAKTLPRKEQWDKSLFAYSCNGLR